jgi:hypothetical protein
MEGALAAKMIVTRDVDSMLDEGHRSDDALSNLESGIMMRYVAPAVENRSQLASADISAVANPQDPLLATNASLVDFVEAVRALPYGRPSDRSVDGLLRERRGTCSTKHLFLAQALRERFPHTQPQIVHRVYRAEREQIRKQYGDEVAAVVPEHGLVDVHRYMLIQIGGRQITLDVTLPGSKPWDGESSLPLACGPGEDVMAGDDPDSDK